MKRSWKTTLFAVLAIVSAGITMVAQPLLDGNEATVPQWSEFVSLAFAAAVGLFAREANVSSEQQGIK